MTILLWIIAGLIAYTFLGYGLLVGILAKLFGRKPAGNGPVPLDATLLIAAHNEEKHIARKIQNALSVDRSPVALRIVIACDGCADATAAIARSFADSGVKVVESIGHVGKIGILNLAMGEIAGDVVIFSDANSEIGKKSLVKLLAHFSDPEVGGVCGAIGVPARGRGWLGLGEAMHWKFDHALKYWESQVTSAVSAQGSLYAVRRNLISEIPPAVADDLYVSLGVVARGFRLAFEPDATVVEGVTGSAKAEFGRRVRSTERGWRGLMMMSTLLNPFKFGFYSIQLFSHKVLRRLVPFLAVLFFLVSLAVAGAGPFYMALAAAQIAGLLAAGLAWLLQAHLPGWALIPVFIIAGNLAMALGVINVMIGKRSDRWTPARSG